MRSDGAVMPQGGLPVMPMPEPYQPEPLDSRPTHIYRSVVTPGLSSRELYYGGGYQQAAADVAFNALDRNRDGHIDRSEWNRAMQGTSPQSGYTVTYPPQSSYFG